MRLAAVNRNGSQRRPNQANVPCSCIIFATLSLSLSLTHSLVAVNVFVSWLMVFFLFQFFLLFTTATVSPIYTVKYGIQVLLNQTHWVQLRAACSYFVFHCVGIELAIASQTFEPVISSFFLHSNSKCHGIVVTAADSSSFS